jgi:hypothetical protein
VIGISGGGSSRRPKSIKECRTRGRRRNIACDFCKLVKCNLHALLASAADAVKWYRHGGPAKNENFTAHFTQ